MIKPTYHRQSRTLTSEQYQLQDGDRHLGYLDVHYGAADVNATLVLERELPEQDLTALIEQIDEDLILASDVLRDRDDLLVRVFVGHEIGFYSEDLLRDEIDEPVDSFDGDA
ncbi:MAG TPA: hypothetical protein VFB58_04305 [Chloroflexota bacterium]|nr:hypothetical protein [Chloroflexota bacterium]